MNSEPVASLHPWDLRGNLLLWPGCKYFQTVFTAELLSCAGANLEYANALSITAYYLHMYSKDLLCSWAVWKCSWFR